MPADQTTRPAILVLMLLCGAARAADDPAVLKVSGPVSIAGVHIDPTDHAGNKQVTLVGYQQKCPPGFSRAFSIADTVIGPDHKPIGGNSWSLCVMDGENGKR